MAILMLTAALSVRMADSAPFAAIVADARTGEILHSENANTRLHPASLTKMLTLYIAFDAVQRGEISLDTMVVVSKNAAAQPPSRLGLRAGQRIALRHLIRAAALRSGNDAASAIGDALSGSEAAFAERMNRTARALGMKNSTFKNANGLTAAGHLSTAADMNHLGRRLFYDFPQYYNIFSRRSDDAGVARVTNTNSRFLAAYKGADGIKTGYTNAAGFNLTASAERGNRRIIATVFGGKSTAHRNARMAELMDLGFRTAPGTATVRKPAPVDLPAEAVASAAANDSGARAAGKTIRLVTVVARSIRPRPRPGDPGQADAAAELVLSMQDSIDGALALATDPPPAAAVETASLAPATAPRPAAVPEALPFAVVDAADEPATAAEAELPFELVGADPEGATEADAPAETFVAAETPVAAPPETALPQDSQQLAIDGPGLRPSPRPDRADPATETVLAGAASDPAATAGATARPAVIQTAASTSPQPPARSGTVQPEGEIVALMAPIAPAAAAPPPPPEPEVVTRISTSGGRHWAINLGRFNTRSSAERVLMRTALSESVVLRESLRKVVQRQGGYEANFVGLSQDQADLACRRLQARAVTCFTLGP
ncbi:serine hydrolase [Szabonella alba]|uniref:serine hydrolase n=1 Tax=Szabonella alba TaxID=2804194 RepID=UPI001F456E26|nr:serine hydrolase [Szabonella alba]